MEEVFVSERIEMREERRTAEEYKMQNVVKDFIPQGGKHCITNSLKQIFSYYCHKLSE